MGELENFPPEAKLKISECGGFEPFLMESLRFVKIGRCIGLAQHAVSLQQAENGASLDELDVIADPDNPGDESGFTSYIHDFSSAQTEIYPMLPNPYVFGCQHVFQPAVRPYFVWSYGDDQEPAHFLPDYYSDPYLDPSEADAAVWEATSEALLKVHAAVQVSTSTTFLQTNM